MEFLLAFAFEVLAFDASIAGCTGAAVELVIMAFAVWRVVDDIEGCSLERFLACVADEAMFVVSTG
jgi:hypothetical protein